MYHDLEPQTRWSRIKRSARKNRRAVSIASVVGLVALVAIVAIATHTSEDHKKAEGLHNRIKASTNEDGGVPLNAQVLGDDQTASLAQSSLGSAVINNAKTALSSDGVAISGDTTVDDTQLTVTGTMKYVSGKLHVSLEMKPAGDSWAIGAMSGGGKSSAFGSQSTTFLFANHNDKVVLSDGSKLSAQPGLNIASDVSVSRIPEFAGFLNGLTPADKRMLADTPSGSSWFNNLLLKIEGLVKPHLKVGTKEFSKKLNLFGGADLVNVTFVVQDKEPRYAVNAVASMTLPGQPEPLNIDVAGSLGNTSFSMSGDSSSIVLKTGSSEDDTTTLNALSFKLNGVKSDDTTKLSGSLSASVTLHGKTLSGSVQYPLPSGSGAQLVLELQNLDISSTVKLTDAKLTLQTATPWVALHGALEISSSLPNSPLSITVDGSIAKNEEFSLTGELTNWNVPLKDGKSIDVKSIKASMQTAKGEPFSGSLTGAVSLADVELDAGVSFPSPSGKGLEIDLSIKTLKVLSLEQVVKELSDSTTSGDIGKLGKALDNIELSEVGVKIITDPVSYEFTASIAKWKINDNIELDNLALDLKVVEEPKKAVSGSFSGAGTFYGTDVTVKTDFPLKTGDLQVTFKNLKLGSDIVVDGAFLFKNNEPTEVSVSGTAKINTGGETVTVSISIDLKKDSWALSGEVKQLTIGKLDLDDVSIAISGVEDTSTKKTAVSGDLKGTLELGKMKLQVEITFPHPTEKLEFDIPKLVLSKRVFLTDVKLDFVNDKSTSLSLDATVHVLMDDLKDPFVCEVTGSIGDGKFSLTGKLTQPWTIHATAKGLVVKTASITLTGEQTATSGDPHITVAIQGEVVLGNWDLVLKVNFDSDTKDLQLDLTLLGAKGMALETTIDDLAGAGSMSGASIPKTTFTEFQKMQLDKVELKINTKPVSFEIDAVAQAFGYDQLSVTLLIQETAAEKWVFGVSCALTNPFVFSNAAPAIKDFDYLKFTSGIIAVTNSPDVMDFKFGTSTLSIKDGVGVEALMPFKDVKDKLPAVSMWKVDVVTVTINFGLDTDHLTFKAELPPNMPIGDEITVNATILIQNFSPEFDLDAKAKIVVDKELEPIVCDVTVEVETDDFIFDGSAEHYHLDIGKHGLEVESIKLHLEYKPKEHSISGKVSGVVEWKNGVQLGMELVVPRPNNLGKGVEIDFVVTNAKSLTFQDAVVNTCGDDVKMQLPSDFSGVTHQPVWKAEMTVYTSPLSLEILGSLELVNIGHETVTAELLIGRNENDATWGFGLGLGISSSFHLSDLMPSFGSLAKSLPSFANGALVVSDMNTPFSFKAGGLTATVTDGVGLAFQMGCPKVIKKWTGIETLEIQGSYGFATHALHLEADIHTDWHIGGLYITEASLFVDIGGTIGFDLGLGVQMMVHVHGQPLRFGGKIMITTHDIVADAYMLDNWVAPFGLKNVIVEHSEVEVGFSFASGMPDLVGISGGLVVGKQSGSATVMINAADFTKSVFAASLSEFSLGGILEKMTDNKIPKSLASTVFECDLQDLYFELNLGTHALVFNQQTFQPGFRFKIGHFNMWNVLKGSMDIEISVATGVLVKATLDPFSIGGVIKVSGYSGPTHPASLDIHIGATDNHFKVDGMISICDIVRIGGYVDIDDTGVTIDAEYQEGVLDIVFKLSAHRSHGKTPGDFSLYAGINTEALDHVVGEVTKKLKEAKAAMDQKMTSELNKLKQWEDHEKPKIAANEKKIAAYQAADKAALNKDQQKLLDAQHKVAKAKAKVDAIQSKIDAEERDKEHCHHHWDIHCHLHNAGCDAKIAAMRIEMKTADAALRLCDDALKVVEKLVSDAEKALVHVDPRVLVLETADAAIVAAGKVAEAAVSGVKKLLDVFGSYVEKLASALQIHDAYISAASVKGVKKSFTVTLGADVTFLGKKHDWAVSMKFPPNVDHMLEGLWDKIKGELHL